MNTIRTALIHVLPVGVLSLGGTVVRALSALQRAEKLGTCHVKHNQKAYVAESEVGRCRSVQLGEKESDLVPTFFNFNVGARLTNFDFTIDERRGPLNPCPR